MEWHLEGIRNIVRGQVKGANKEIERYEDYIRTSKGENFTQSYTNNLSYWKGIKKEAELVIDTIDEKLRLIRESEMFTKEAMEKSEREGDCPF